MTTTLVEPGWIRNEIVQRILTNFESTLPIYNEMMAVARQINEAAGESEAKRLGKIMHAAIRCASFDELRTIRDLFALIGNHPVNYYDLRERVSVESTAFRPITVEEIERNGFRIFCSKLAIECIPPEHQAFVNEIISRRHIFDQQLLGLIETGKAQGGLGPDQARQFIEKCVAVFTRPEEALISFSEYEQLKAINKVAAQILISNSLAFNHLTPSVASVPTAHDEMQRRGIKTIPVWQGPVGKNVILRQTSCLAPPVVLKFPNGDGTFIEADYQETFVEFEERLQALTAKGRTIFEDLFAQGKQNLRLSESDPGYAAHYYETMKAALADFPDAPLQLWKQQLAYFKFDWSDPELPQTAGRTGKNRFEDAVESGIVLLVPQQYEDFFGPAATNIFNSNIGLEGVSHVGIAKPDSQSTFEANLGQEVIDMYVYYEQIQQESMDRIQAQLDA